MPRQLIQKAAQRLGFDVARLDPGNAYALALEMGTSYAATVRHLSDMRLITASWRDLLLKTPPQVIKRSLGGLEAVADSWRDVWLVRNRQDDYELDVQEGDAVVIEAPEVPSNGYLWQLTSLPDGLALVREDYRDASEAEVLGAHGTHRFLFRVDEPGHRQVRLELRRPWQSSASPAEERRVVIAAEPRPVAGIVQPRLLVPAGA
jgi:predicted secreted protein